MEDGGAVPDVGEDAEMDALGVPEAGGGAGCAGSWIPGWTWAVLPELST